MKFTNKFIKINSSITQTIRVNKIILTKTKVDIINQAFFYKHIGANITRNFSSTTEPSNEIIDTSEIDNSLDLQKLTVKKLREIAKKNGINLKGYRKKKDIIIQIELYFSSKNKSSDLEIRPTNFEIVSDGKGRVNISLWFQYYTKELGFNASTRFLTSNQTRRLADIICRRENLELNEVIHQTELGIFAHPLIALRAAIYLNDDTYYDVHQFYLIARPAEIQKQITERALEQADLYIKELGIKLNHHVNWDKFDFPFAYYLIKIDDTVKAGIVGEKEESKTESLDSRLTVHRSTYARLELINVFEFRESTTVKLFEQVTKHLLFEHNIGLDKNMKLEQYECPGKDVGQIINELVSQEFKNLRFEDQHLGMECPKEKIDDYNKISSKRLVSTVIDNSGEEKRDT